MSDKDKILFEQRFYQKGLYKVNPSNFNFLLSIILNIQELRDTSIKISDNKNVSHLLNVVFTPLDSDKRNVYFSLLYYVSDGVVSENRSMTGNILFNSNTISVVSHVDRFTNSSLGDTVSVPYVLLDVLRFTPDSVLTDSINFMQSVITSSVINMDDFYSLDKFMEETLKRLNRG